MRVWLFAAAFGAVACASPVALSDPLVAAGQLDARAPPEHAARVLYVCDDTAFVRRAFAREYGAVEFVRAEEARQAGPAWDRPKCITPRDAARLRDLLAGR